MKSTHTKMTSPNPSSPNPASPPQQQQQQNFSLLSHPPLPISHLLKVYNPEDTVTQNLIRDTFSALGKESSGTSSAKGIRIVTGDGNCFIRSFTYGLIRYYLEKESSPESSQRSENDSKDDNATPAGAIPDLLQQLKQIYSKIEESEGDISHIAFFYEEFVESLQNIQSHEDLIRLMNDKEATTAIIWWQRMICSWYLQSHKEEFEPFVQGEGHATVKSYCDNVVLPLDRECDNLAITGMCEAFGVSVEILYLDSKQSYKVKLPEREDAPLVVQLLFRPGHYDILESECTTD